MELPSKEMHSLACRYCHRGWKGSPGEKCKGCGREAEVTGTWSEAFLFGEEDDDAS